MSTGGIGFAGATQDDEFEALLQETYQRYAVDDPFANLLMEQATTSPLLPVFASQSSNIPVAQPQTSKVVSPQPHSEIEDSDHSSVDQDYKPTRSQKRRTTKVTQSASVSESSTSEKDPAKEKSKVRALIQPNDLQDYHKGIERLQKALAKFKEDSRNTTIREELSAKEQKAWKRKEKNKHSAQVSRYQKAIAELEEKIEMEKLMNENKKLTAHNRDLLRANAELNSRVTLMQNTPPDTSALKALKEEVSSLKRMHQDVLKSFTDLKEKAEALQAKSARQEKEAEENIESLCKKLTELKEVEGYGRDLENQVLELSTEKKQLEKMLEEVKIAKQQAEANQHTLNQTFQTLVARYEAERQVEKQKMAADEAERKTYLTKMRAKFEHDLRPLQAQVASLTAQEAEHVHHIQWQREKIQRLESQSHQQRVDYNELGDILQRREEALTALESYVGNLEDRSRRDEAYIQDLEAQIASLRQERSPNPPLIYSSRAPIGKYYHLQPQSGMRGTVNLIPASDPKRSKFS